MKVLIVDDNTDKIKEVIKVFNKKIGKLTLQQVQ